MKGKGGYLLIDLASDNLFNELLIAMEFGKPILLKADKQNFFADLISGGEVTAYVLDEDNEPTDEPLTYSDIIITFGGGVITVEQDNDVTISYNDDEINTENLNTENVNTETINSTAENPNWSINDDGELQTKSGVEYRTDSIGNVDGSFDIIDDTASNTLKFDLNEGDILYNGVSVLGGGGSIELAMNTPYFNYTSTARAYVVKLPSITCDSSINVISNTTKLFKDYYGINNATSTSNPIDLLPVEVIYASDGKVLNGCIRYTFVGGAIVINIYITEADGTVSTNTLDASNYLANIKKVIS